MHFENETGQRSQWGDACFASRRWRVRSPCGPLEAVVMEHLADMAVDVIPVATFPREEV